jgi:2-polyprenyl-3-methyl-5-hydroxy-6-metoxy-1,4-benzoquinol methylase
MTYDPRTYWPDRARQQGPLYVTLNGKDGQFSIRQAEVFAAGLDGIRATRLLDFGCGPGRLAPALGRQCEHYVGVDIVEASIKHAQEAAGDNCTFIHLHDDTLPEHIRPIDTVVAVTVFQHIPDEDLQIWASELQHVVTPGANYYIIDDCARRQWYQDTAEHVFRRRPEVLAEILGIDIHRVAYVHADFKESHYLLHGVIRP